MNQSSHSNDFSDEGLIENIDDVIASYVADHEDVKLLNIISNSIRTPLVNDMHDNDLSGIFYIMETTNAPSGIYKIGKAPYTSGKHSYYPELSHIKYTVPISDCYGFESYVTRKFRILFKRHREYGMDYYEGDLKTMINIAHSLWNDFNNSSKNIINQSLEYKKPIGFQYFVNEWYSHQNNPSLEESYIKYQKMMTDIFMSNDYASKKTFAIYLHNILL